MATQKAGATVKYVGAAPARAHDTDAGYDLRALMDDPRGYIIRPGEIKVFDTETLGIELPPSLAAMIVPRSGLAATRGLTVLNGPGLIDPGYRGPIKVCLHHAGSAAHGAQPVHIKPGDRIAQLVLIAVATPEFVPASSELEDSDRGAKGFGSSGVE